MIISIRLSEEADLNAVGFDNDLFLIRDNTYPQRECGGKMVFDTIRCRISVRGERPNWCSLILEPPREPDPVPRRSTERMADTMRGLSRVFGRAPIEGASDTRLYQRLLHRRVRLGSILGTCNMGGH